MTRYHKLDTSFTRNVHDDFTKTADVPVLEEQDLLQHDFNGTPLKRVSPYPIQGVVFDGEKKGQPAMEEVEERLEREG